MKQYTITDEDFNRCIGEWLNADNPNYQEYVKGIKLFREYLDEKDSESSVVGDKTNLERDKG